MDSGRYTSYLYVVTIDILAFVPSWHQGLHPGLEEIHVNFLLL